MNPVFYTLPIALVLDFVMGDPHWLPHPIRWMGTAIARCEPRFRRLIADPFWAGTALALVLIASATGATLLALKVAGLVHPTARTIVEIVLIYFALSARSLGTAALTVHAALRQPDLEAARCRLAMIVGRDVNSLSRAGIIRAAVETVAENLVDGFIAPLLYAAVGGAPLAMAYKMINTLDSMVGYKNKQYVLFGRAAARIDDAANYIPARLAVPLIAAAAHWIGSKGTAAFKTALLDGRHHTSPNAGYPEAAFAGALGLRLGGPNLYGRQLVAKPYIGRNRTPARRRHILKACQLMYVTALVAGVCFYGLQLMLHNLGL